MCDHLVQDVLGSIGGVLLVLLSPQMLASLAQSVQSASAFPG